MFRMLPADRSGKIYLVPTRTQQWVLVRTAARAVQCPDVSLASAQRLLVAGMPWLRVISGRCADRPCHLVVHVVCATAESSEVRRRLPDGDSLRAGPLQNKALRTEGKEPFAVAPEHLPPAYGAACAASGGASSAVDCALTRRQNSDANLDAISSSFARLGLWGRHLSDPHSGLRGYAASLVNAGQQYIDGCMLRAVRGYSLQDTDQKRLKRAGRRGSTTTTQVDDVCTQRTAGEQGNRRGVRGQQMSARTHTLAVL